jgi:DNA-binding CsgD family transcriptional regulator
MNARHEPRLWGRLAELEALDRLLAATRTGSGAALVIQGPAGVGKSTLLDRFVAGATGCQIARSTGIESESELAFAGLHQLCAPFLDRLDRLPVPQRDALAAAFGLRESAPPNRFLVGLAVLNLLTGIAEAGPLVCALDDAQWLDAATMQVLGFAARRLASVPVIIIVAVREIAGDGHLAGLPALELAPLRDADARGLLGSALAGRLDERVRDRIVAEAAGNPQTLLQVTHAWTPAALAGGYGLPDRVCVTGPLAETIRRRLTPLPDDCRLMLLLAAAEGFGDAAVIWAAADRIGLSPQAAAPATAAGLLDPGTRLRFRHPLARSVVYRSAPVGDRRLVHDALAQVIDPLVDPDRRAWHLAAAAAGPDDNLALELEHAVDRARSRGGLAAAGAFLRRAAELTVSPRPRSRRALAAAQTCLQAGAFDAASSLAELAEGGPLDGLQRARLDLVRGQAAFAFAPGADAALLLIRAARRLEAFDLVLAREAYLLAWCAAGRAGAAGSDVRLEVVRRVKTLAATPIRPPAIEELLDGLIAATTAGPAAAVPTLHRAAAAIRELPPEDIVCWGALTIAPNAVLWDVEAMIETSDRYLRVARDAGALAVLPCILDNAGVARAWLGDLATAASLAAEARRIANATGGAIPDGATVRIHGLQGREAEVAAAIENARNQGRSSAAAHAAAAVVFNAFGRYADAMSAAQLASSEHADPWMSLWSLPELIEAASRQAAVDVARDALERLAPATRAADNDLALGIEARCRALVDSDAAEEWHRAAIDRLGRTRVRPDLARAHLLYGEWLRREGRRVDAREQLRIAFAIFDDVGMDGFAERARHELVATGETVRKRTRETSDELTPQEAQIARLAGDGRTNHEIAAQLFLSPRTVEWHLRKVFAKLGISSRRDLRAAQLPRPMRLAAFTTRATATYDDQSSIQDHSLV